MTNKMQQTRIVERQQDVANNDGKIDKRELFHLLSQNCKIDIILRMLDMKNAG